MLSLFVASSLSVALLPSTVSLLSTGIVIVNTINGGVTTNGRFVGVGSTDPTFAHLPNERVKEDLRFLPALMRAGTLVCTN